MDAHHLFNDGASMRGFVTIFWVFITFQFIVHAYKNYKLTGSVVPCTVGKLIFGDGRGFWALEAVLIAMSYGGLGLQLIAQWGASHNWTSLTHRGALYWVLRFGLELFIIGMPMVFSVKRGWHGIQRGAYLLHSLSMGMKVHSFLSININCPPRAEFRDYTNYLLAPTVVYCRNFPRTPRIRPLVVVEKFTGAAVAFIMLYMIVEFQLYPVLVPKDNGHSIDMLDALIHLFPALIAVFILLFILIFECLLNLFAELSRFADRHFYSDWWNSVSYADFARKWNVPVHRFLLYHVYLESIRSLQINKFTASILTFLISSVFHELVMSVMMGSGPYWYLFVMQMLQIPFIWLGTRPTVQRYPVVANFAFWITLSIGPPLLTIAYSREHYKNGSS